MQVSLQDKSREPMPWDVPAWVTKAARWLSNCMFSVGILIAFFLAVAAFSETGTQKELLALIFVPAMGFVTIILHESGHVVGARLAGMKPIIMQVWKFALFKRRRGWKFRKVSAWKGLAGYVMAYPDPRRSLKQSMVTMVLGGPLANIACATCFFGLFAVIGRNGAGILCLSFAVINVLAGVANLLPAMRHYASDGLLLLWWLRGFPEDHPSNLYVRLMGRSVFGETADELPAEEVDELERQGPEAALIADWIRLKAAQNRGQWSVAASMQGAFETKLVAMSEQQKQGLKILIAAQDAELSFSAAMAARDAGLLQAEDAMTLLRPDLPHLFTRFHALRCALAGDTEEARIACEQSERLAKETIDDALIRSEAWMSRRILQLAEERPA